MAAIEIISQGQASAYSKPFRVDVGKVLVISSFNFQCEQTNEIGEVTRPADCAILHKIEMGGDALPQADGCGCILDGLETSVLSSEPVVQCGSNWTHNAQTNLTVLSVPGFYMFEVCNADSIGNISMKVEELDATDATLIPKQLFHGEC